MDELTKKQVRLSLLDYRRLLSPVVYHERNQQICEHVFEFVKANDFKVIHTFLAIKRNNEPDIRPVVDKLLKKGVEILVSRTNFSDRKMEHFYLRPETELVENSLGIPEPVNAEPANFKTVDAILTPLVVADKNCNRLGYGGGFYDQLLKQTNATKIGLSLTPLLDQLVNIDPWDIPLDLIITPNF